MVAEVVLILVASDERRTFQQDVASTPVVHPIAIHLEQVHCFLNLPFRSESVSLELDDARPSAWMSRTVLDQATDDRYVFAFAIELHHVHAGDVVLLAEKVPAEAWHSSRHQKIQALDMVEHGL